MRKEIFEQPKAVADTLLGPLRRERRADPGRDPDLRGRAAARSTRSSIIACGTAFYAGLVAKYAIEHWTRIPCEVELASEFRYRDPIVGPDAPWWSAISQSGETADTLMAIRHAREQRARVLAICNTNGSTIPRESDAVIYTHAGPEIGVASTKGFLTQLVACYLLGLYLAQVRGTKFGDEIAPLMRRAGRPCRPRSRAVLAEMDPVLKLAADFADEPSVLFLGRHVGYPVALEGALKLKELAYIHAEGFAAGELKHGPIALIEDELPVFVVDAAAGPGPAARQGGLQHPGDPGPRRADRSCWPRRTTTRWTPYADVLIRLPKVLDPAAAAGGHRAAAGVRLRAGHPQGPRRRPAAQPGQVRHRRVRSSAQRARASRRS